ncbi:hypothetical protein T4D_5928 [Trichinella pseudospiralis]|uniref:Uncharacterized protein n=1 Tax=Trichinella pseudospiralis TaxID=6337 RepID=A0A0V1F519_TRIPS|nr:hypothetical protein T4D_13561 [Trichinella pseudospiralis]KRY81768.1 hypothetical protein T4D_5928 [Trichinella pseudospiralis]
MPSLKREAERRGKAAANTRPSTNSEGRANSLAEETDEPARGSGSLHMELFQVSSNGHRKGIDPKPAFPNSYYRRKDTGGLRSGYRKKKYTVADSTGEIAEFKRQLNGSELFIRKRRPTLIRKEKRCGCSQFRGSNGKNIHQIIGWRL